MASYIDVMIDRWNQVARSAAYEQSHCSVHQ